MLSQSTTAGNERRAVEILTLAFSTDPVARFMYPETGRYLESFPKFIRAFGGKAFDLGTANVAASLTGAALWLPPEVSPDEDQLIPLLAATVGADRFGRIMEILEGMGQFHPHEPHWYLPMLGVDPAFQGRGQGSQLLRNTLRRCDSERMLAYLESSNPRNIPLYERHGFKGIGVIRVDDAPCLYPMLRTPRT